MANIERRAEATWEGGLAQGSGRVAVGTGALAPQPVTWASRTAEPAGRTSPEELIAAAHASCYSMALAHVLGERGVIPERLVVESVVSLEPQAAGGFRITRSRLTVRGRTSGLDSAGFAEAAALAEAGCPVSNALRNNVAIEVDAQLETVAV